MRPRIQRYPHYINIGYTDRYALLPTIDHKYPFLAQIQLPLLESFRKCITSSLESFETLSSTFARAVPGALAGHARDTGLSMDTARMTSGVVGLTRLIKAWVGAEYLAEAMHKWGDELVSLTFVR